MSDTTEADRGQTETPQAPGQPPQGLRPCAALPTPGELSAITPQVPSGDKVQQEWWMAVHSVAEMVHRDGIAIDDDRGIRTQLAARGFSALGIVTAMDWMEKAALSGGLADMLGMLQPMAANLRVEHPIERASLHPRLLRTIEVCRWRGWVTSDMAERLLEGVRALDTRDWEDPQIEEFLAEVLGVSAPHLAGLPLATVLDGNPTAKLYN